MFAPADEMFGGFVATKSSRRERTPSRRGFRGSAPATSAVLAVEALSAAARGLLRKENSRMVLPGWSEAGSRKWSRGHLRMGTAKPGAPAKTPRLVAPEERAYHAWLGLGSGSGSGLGKG